MSERVKRGLGLVAIGLIGLVFVVATRQAQADGGSAPVLLGVAGVAGVWVGIYGLALVALGLLRD